MGASVTGGATRPEFFFFATEFAAAALEGDSEYAYPRAVLKSFERADMPTNGSGLYRYEQLDTYESGAVLYFHFNGKQMVAVIRRQADCDKPICDGDSLDGDATQCAPTRPAIDCAPWLCSNSFHGKALEVSTLTSRRHHDGD